MASPQCENGFLKVANELSEALSRLEASGREHRVIWAVARMTYGYSKKSSEISYGQISKMTGIDRTNTIKIVNLLVSKMTLGRVKNDTSGRVIIWINKDYDKWIGRVKNDTSVKNNPTTRVKNNPKSRVENDTPLNKERKKRKEPLPLTEIPTWLDPQIWSDWVQYRKDTKKAMTSKAEVLAIKTLGKLRDRGFNPEDVINQSIESGWTGLFEPKISKGRSMKSSGSTLLDRSDDFFPIGEPDAF